MASRCGTCAVIVHSVRAHVFVDVRYILMNTYGMRVSLHFNRCCGFFWYCSFVCAVVGIFTKLGLKSGLYILGQPYDMPH